MVVLVALVLGFVAFRELNRDEPASPVDEVDYTRTVEFAEGQAGVDLPAPRSLPRGWRATSVDFVPGEKGRWHLGMLTDEDRYVGLEQSAGSAESMVHTHVDPQASRGGSVTIAGDEWRIWTDEGGDQALVRSTDSTTTLVVGHDVPRAELVDFVASLR